MANRGARVYARRSMTLSTLSFKIYDFCVRHRIHFIAWGCFIIYEVFITGLIMGELGQTGAYIISYILAISFFYLHAYLLKFTARRKRLPLRVLSIILIVIFELLAYALVNFGLRYSAYLLNLITASAPPSITKTFIYTIIWRALYIIGFGTGYFYILKFLENRKTVEELKRKGLLDQIERHTLENSLIQTQNNYLRSQINPHFLFNTLNFIYNDARKKAPIAADAIMNLSEMMRYALKRNEALELVPIVDEIAQVEHLIQLHRLRTKHPLNINLTIEGDLMGVRFPPLILLTLVENMFKHGDILHPTNSAVINLKHFDNVLEIKLFNLIGPTQKNNNNSNKVGVANTKTRLENIYKRHCSFTYFVDQLKNTYTSELIVNLAYNPKQIAP